VPLQLRLALVEGINTVFHKPMQCTGYVPHAHNNNFLLSASLLLASGTALVPRARPRPISRNRPCLV
jgi:hypothetical protein